MIEQHWFTRPCSTLIRRRSTTCPGLATHWQISPDHMTYRFRIDPNARFSDGQPVTAEDVVATWTLDDGQGSSGSHDAARLTKSTTSLSPRASYIVQRHEQGAQLAELPVLRGMMPILSRARPENCRRRIGMSRNTTSRCCQVPDPYIVNESDVVRGRSAHDPATAGLLGRERIAATSARTTSTRSSRSSSAIRTSRSRCSSAGTSIITRPSMRRIGCRSWVTIDRIQRGLIQKRKVYNDYPMGTVGMAINMRKAPFDDVRVRQALAHLLNRRVDRRKAVLQ